MTPTQLNPCQQEGCTQRGTWVIRGYFTKGGTAAVKHQTRDMVRCDDHSKDQRAVNPFSGWEPLR